MPKVVDMDTCIGCGACIGSCPTSCIKANDEGKSIIEVGSCVDCGACEEACPVGAITAQ